MSKSFKESAQSALSNPAMQFITPTAPQDAAEHKSKPAARKESKSRRLQLLIKPSVYESIKERADKSGTSVNDWVNGVIERALGTGEAVTLEEVLRQYQSGDN